MPRASSSRLYSRRALVAGELHAIGPGLAAVFTASWSGEEEGGSPNEDAAAILPFDDNTGLLVVADGVGGLPQGEAASDLTIRTLRDALLTARREGSDLRGAILDGIESANRKVMGLKLGAATTVAIVEIKGQTMRPYHVGDSQVMVVSSRGRVKLCTKSHSPVGYAVEAGLLEVDEALHHEERHLVSNLVGSADMHIEIGPLIDLSPSDTVIIASDGLFDNVHQEEIASLSRKGPLLGVLHQLSSLSKQRMEDPEPGMPSKPDDATIIVYRQRATADKDGPP